MRRHVRRNVGGRRSCRRSGPSQPGPSNRDCPALLARLDARTGRRDARPAAGDREVAASLRACGAPDGAEGDGTMRPEMDDVELAQLEQRLRRSAAGHRPQAPDALVRFIDKVPAGSRAGRDAVLMRVGSRTRRGFLAIATAAALVVAVVTAVTFVSLRNGQFGAGPQGSSGAGWSWQKADGTAVQSVFQVSNGYLDVCVANQDAALCSSPDGINWTTPADPAIVAVEGGGQFVPVLIAHYGGTYVAIALPTGLASTATPTPIVAPSDGSTAASGGGDTLSRSPDAVNWGQGD